MNRVEQLHENDRFQELFDDLFGTDRVSDMTYSSGANHTGYPMQSKNVTSYQASSNTEGRRSSLPGEYGRGLDYVSRDTAATASEYFIDPRLLNIEPSMLHTQTPTGFSSAGSDSISIAEDGKYNHRSEKIYSEDENVLKNQFYNHPPSSQFSQSQVENNLMHGVSECHSAFDVTLNDCVNDITAPDSTLANYPPIYYCLQPGCPLSIGYFPLSQSELDEHNAEDHPMSAVQVNLGGEGSTLPFANERSMFVLCLQPGCQSNIENVPFTREELDEHMAQYHSPFALGFDPDYGNTSQSLNNEPPIFDSALEDNLALLDRGGVTPSDYPDSTKESPHPEYPFVAASVADPSLQENNFPTLGQTDVAPTNGSSPEDDRVAMFSQDDSDDEFDSIEENPVPEPALVVPEPDAQGRIRCTVGGCSNKTGFVKEGTYRTHMRKHHNGPDEPEKKARKTKADLVPAEDASKTMEDGKLTWRCKLPGCDHKSSSKNSFTRHYLSKHVAANRDHCPLCNWSPDDKVKDFGRADSVQKHISRFHAQVSKNDPKIKRTLDKLRRSTGERNVWDHSNEPAGKGFEGRDEDGLLPEEKISGCPKKRRRVTGESKPKPKKPKNVAGSLDRNSQANDGSSYEEADSDDEQPPGDRIEVSNKISTRKKPSINLRKHNRDSTDVTDLQPKKKAKTSHETTSGDTNSPGETESTQASSDETNYSVPSNTSAPPTEHETVNQNTEMSAETVTGNTAYVNHYNALITSALQQLEQERHDPDDSFGNHNSSLEQTLPQHRAANTQVSETSSMNQNSFHHGSCYQFAGHFYTPSTISTNNTEWQNSLNAIPGTEQLNQNQVLTDPYPHSNRATFNHPTGGIVGNNENIPAYAENTQRYPSDDEKLIAMIKEAIYSEAPDRNYN